jgi:hypothetical protein
MQLTPTSKLNVTTPRVIWPAPGLPAFVEGERRCFTALVEHDRGTDELRDWASLLALQCPVTGKSIALQATSVRRLEPTIPHPFAAEYQRGRIGSRPLFEVEIAVPQLLAPQAPRTAMIFNLTRDGVVERANAVAVLAEGRRTLRLAFATDLHVSRAWEAIDAAVDKHAPDLASQYYHPQRLLSAFVDESNELAARGELDLVVLGGDLVDHVYMELQSASFARSTDSNVSLLLDLLAPLTVPVLAIPGNHDYRVNPWRPRVFGLGSVGLTYEQSRRLLKAAGLWERWPMRLSDRSALHTNGANGSHGLHEHLSALAPATDFFVDVRGMRLVFFATGRDMVPFWETLDWRRRALLARSLPTSWHDPDSEGPSDDQASWLESTLSGAHHAAVFFHAPILHPRPRQRVEQLIKHIDPGSREGASTTIAFERRLFASGLRRGVSFRNVARVVRALLSVPGSVTTFSGHVHRSSRIEVQRSSLRLRSASFAPHTDEPTTMALHIGAALGHVRTPGDEPPSYLLAELEAGTLRSVQRRPVAPHPRS